MPDPHASRDISGAGGAEIPLPPTDPIEDDLARRMGLMLDEATELAQMPLRALADFHRGFIETVARDDSGLCWVSGWLHKEAPLEFPAVILDRQKFPAAVALTSYPRDDLPDHAHAVIGTIRTDWRPSSAEAEIFLFFGEELRHWQRGLKPLRLMEPAAALEQFNAVRAICTGRLTGAIQKLVASPESWVPDSARAVGFAAHAAMDRLIMLPGFGCLAEGWAMSPAKRVERLAIKCGERVMHADPLATYFRARGDLRDAFPGCGGAVAERAGFVTVFRGRIRPEEFMEPILKVVYADGTSSNHPVGPQSMRQLGHSAAMEEVLLLYPSLRQEAFFADFARALRRDAAARIGGLTAWRSTPCPDRAVVLALPRGRSDLYLLLEEVRDLAARLPDPPGFVVLAERGTNRAELLTLFAGLVEAAGERSPCSLFFVDEIEQAFRLCGPALEAAGARRFLFLGPDIVLSAEGWARGLALLDAMADGAPPQLLGIEGGEDGADVLVWTADAFRAALPRLPVFLGGRHGDQGLAAAGFVPVMHPGMGLRSDGGRGISALTRAINGVEGAGSRHG